MFKHYNYLRAIAFTISITWCYGYVNYEMFKGFDLNLDSNRVIETIHNNTDNGHWNITKMISVNVSSTNITKPQTEKPAVKLKKFKKICPETEVPSNLGTYEIPTQRDLVLFTTRTLSKMFNSYHKKTLFLLKDINEATKATREVENKCVSHRASYKKCVQRVSKKCVSIVKDLVASKETQKESVISLLEGTTCNMTEIKTDPIQLIKTLAMDEASLEFALPAFLRLIGECSIHCLKQFTNEQIIRRPSRHMTDQDLVVRHFLTNKNYIQLIMDSNTRV